MKGFLLGLVVGALGTYAAIKLSDEEVREELYNKANNAAARARGDIDHGLAVGKSKALRAGVMARQEVRKGTQKINQVAGDVAGRLVDELSSFEEKANARAANTKI